MFTVCPVLSSWKWRRSLWFHPGTNWRIVLRACGIAWAVRTRRRGNSNRSHWALSVMISKGYELVHLRSWHQKRKQKMVTLKFVATKYFNRKLVYNNNKSCQFFKDHNDAVFISLLSRSIYEYINISRAGLNKLTIWVFVWYQLSNYINWF